MRLSPHPLIVKYIDDFNDNKGHICIVEEYYPDGDFDNYLT